VTNFFLWLGILVSLIFIEGLTPNSIHSMLVWETVALVFWCFVGVVLAIRGMYRIVTAAKQKQHR
jgi:hypothetical protein